MGGTYQPGDEVVPNYRLERFLGEGGYGQVWKAIGPGGLKVALKIIPLVGRGSVREYRAIRQMKDIRQPNLVEIFGIWLKDQNGRVIVDDPQPISMTAMISPTPGNPSELVIAMGLGNGSLYDLLQEYLKKGVKGIPFPELIEYMEDAAGGIDYLNRPIHNLSEDQRGVAIEHCDIKPQNLLQVGNSVQVCDFGLARALSGASATMTAAQNITPYYAAPELLTEGRPSARTDQYMLAVSYIEMRTGKLPFPDNLSRFEVMERHYEGKLDLGQLPPHEQAVIRRAVSLDPEERWESATRMVEELRRPGTEGPQGPAEIVLAPGAKIGLGYTLVSPLEQHPTIQIWKAQAPGGREVAIVCRSLDREATAVDLQALHLITGTEGIHRHLSEMHAVWIMSTRGQEVTFADEMERSVRAGEAKWLYIAGRLVGQTMEDLLRGRGRRGFLWAELRDGMYGLADAIDFLNAPQHRHHSRAVSILHNNIRPASLLPEGNPFHLLRLGNHSLARILNGEFMQVPPGSIPDHAFLAPEAREGRLTRRSDQYSLALTYLILRSGGECPRNPEEMRRRIDAIRSGAGANLFAPGELEIVGTALDPDPRRRYQSCMAFVQELDSLDEPEPAGGWWWLVPYIVLGLLLAGGVVYLRHNPEVLERIRAALSGGK